MEPGPVVLVTTYDGKKDKHHDHLDYENEFDPDSDFDFECTDVLKIRMAVMKQLTD